MFRISKRRTYILIDKICNIGILLIDQNENSVILSFLVKRTRMTVNKAIYLMQQYNNLIN